MTQTRHTPGPYRVTPRRDDESALEILADETCVATVPIWWGPDEDDDALEAEARANAALLAAAPEMLAALELCADVLSELARLDDGTPSISALTLTRAAISKATG